MSSIYRKGRDGYYYYQAYIYNPESNKKDKRVFHSLSTKELLVAKKKQNKLDAEYEKQEHLNSNTLGLINNFKPKIIIPIIAGTIAITILVLNIFYFTIVKQKQNDSSNSEKVKIVLEKIHSTPKIIEPVKVVIKEKKNLIKENKTKIKNQAFHSKPIAYKVTIPKYTVERVDRLSGAFEQGKLYVTINKNLNNNSQRLICEDITKRFHEFSNIVICLYSNNHSGIELAKGNDRSVSVEEQKRSWLAMYTYNSVEGEYFDDNPSGYLGLY